MKIIPRILTTILPPLAYACFVYTQRPDVTDNFGWHFLTLFSLLRLVYLMRPALWLDRSNLKWFVAAGLSSAVVYFINQQVFFITLAGVLLLSIPAYSMKGDLSMHMKKLFNRVKPT